MAGNRPVGRTARTAWIRIVEVVFAVLAAFGSAWAEDAPRVVIIGFDGADPHLIQKYKDEGILPNLAALEQSGTFRPLLPTNPPQTPVSWSSFATGLDPGRTQIFDFLRRDPGRYVPDFSLARRGRTTVGLGEWNGWAAGALVGLIAAFVVVIGLRWLRAGWRTAALAGAAGFVAATAAAAVPLGKMLPAEMPTATNNRQGTPFWSVAAEAGWKVGVVRVPVTFPSEDLPAGSFMISGLGVPDMRGRVGTPTLWSTDPTRKDRENQFSLDLVLLPARRGPVSSRILGPYNYPFHVYVVDRAEARWKAEGIPASERRRRRKELKAKLEAEGSPEVMSAPVSFTLGEDSVRWEVSGRSGELRAGEWSDWVVIDFPVNPLADRIAPLRGMGRFRLVTLDDDDVEIYFSPLNFHPSCHPIPYSTPADLAEELAREGGLFKTMGWAIDTWSYPSGVGGIDLFLEDMEFTVARYEQLMQQLIDTPDLDMFVQIFYFPDRAGHMMWSQLDPGHPLHDPATAPAYEDAMRRVYRKMDEIVGRAREHVGPDTLFLVLSDHGFSSFRRQININTWLYKHGYLALEGVPPTRDLEQLFDRDVKNVDVLQGIDWSATKAWAMGLGAIYINVVGREPEGIVMPGEEYERIKREIREGLEAEVDPATGVHPIVKVYDRDEMYREGFDERIVPDLRAANRLDYRVSWQDTLGGLSTEVFEDNDRYWSGDHCSLDPNAVRGILFINRDLTVSDPAMVDIAPSILAEFGFEPPQPLDGRVIW